MLIGIRVSILIVSHIFRLKNVVEVTKATIHVSAHDRGEFSFAHRDQEAAQLAEQIWIEVLGIFWLYITANKDKCWHKVQPEGYKACVKKIVVYRQ